MVKSLLFGMALTLAGNPVLAQEPPLRNCLHGDRESSAERARRQQAIDYVMRVNAAEGVSALAPRGYRPLEQLANLPAPPPGFTIHFYNEARSYLLSLKDDRDACHYAVFTDQDRLIYEAVPKMEPRVIPLETR